RRLFWAGNPSASIQQFRPYRRGSTGSSTVPGGSAQSLPRTCGQEALPLMTVASKPTAAATPAVRVLNLAGIDYSLRSFDHDPAARRYGSEAADKLGVSSDQVFQPLMTQVDGAPVTALVPVSGQLDLKGLASARGAKKAQLSGVAETERRTGYPVGGVSPFGQRHAVPVVIDRTALEHACVFVSAGRRGLEIEIRPEDLVMLTNAQVAKIATLD